jgi:hypothetical protein
MRLKQNNVRGSRGGYPMSIAVAEMRLRAHRAPHVSVDSLDTSQSCERPFAP